MIFWLIFRNNNDNLKNKFWKIKQYKEPIIKKQNRPHKNELKIYLANIKDIKINRLSPIHLFTFISKSRIKQKKWKWRYRNKS